jgi:hypothetical protein
MTHITRRRVLFGTAVLGLSAITPRAEGTEDTELVALGNRLGRLGRRVRRLRSRVRPGGDSVAWLSWSGAVTECAELCERIAESPVDGIAGLAVRYKALLWELVEDDVVMDRTTRRRAIRFGSRSPGSGGTNEAQEQVITLSHNGISHANSRPHHPAPESAVSSHHPDRRPSRTSAAYGDKRKIRREAQ